LILSKVSLSEAGSMNEVLKHIQKIGIVPVVVINDARDAVPLAKALIDGGQICLISGFWPAAEAGW